MVTEDELNSLATVTLDAAFRVHRTLGPGLLESIYKSCLGMELVSSGLQIEAEVPVAVVYAGVQIADIGFRIDLLVNRTLVVEVKAVEVLAPVHKAQLLSYLKLSRKTLGLLINFNTVLLKDGIKRVINRP